MKFIKHVTQIFNRKGRRREDVLYYDNYTLFGSIMGGYCGLLKLNGKGR